MQTNILIYTIGIIIASVMIFSVDLGMGFWDRLAFLAGVIILFVFMYLWWVLPITMAKDKGHSGLVMFIIMLLIPFPIPLLIAILLPRRARIRRQGCWFFFIY